MKLTFTENILLFMADLEDKRRAAFNIKASLLYLSGHPALHKNYIGMAKFLEKRKKRPKFQNVLYRLLKRKVLQIKMNGKTCGYAITDKGKNELFKLRMKKLKKNKLSKSRLLMVFFDIPETKRDLRDSLRDMLINIGFEKLQRSIWITDFDVVKDVSEFLNKNHLKKMAKMMIVEKKFF